MGTKQPFTGQPKKSVKSCEAYLCDWQSIEGLHSASANCVCDWPSTNTTHHGRPGGYDIEPDRGCRKESTVYSNTPS